MHDSYSEGAARQALWDEGKVFFVNWMEGKLNFCDDCGGGKCTVCENCLAELAAAE